MRIKIIPCLAILYLSTAYGLAQQNDSCRVMLKEISGTYSGQCKDGLANGKGTAKAEDTYTGMFKNGLPDGKGKYTFRNGDVFDGYWTSGLKNGVGKFSYTVNGKKMTMKGYWKNGEYVGTTNPDEYYRITSQTGIESYSIKKIDDKGSQIKISFVGAMVKYVPTGLTVNTSSGNMHKENKNFSIYDFICPNNCSIHYIIRTSGGDRQCYLEFEILKPGKYEVLITNN